jgi:hypothetical protein
MARQITQFSPLTEIAQAVMGLLRGEQNNAGSFTLTPGATSTVVSFVNCAASSKINITPQTANAAAALATTYIPPATVVNGAFTVRHASAGTSDRTFFFEVTGGD